MNDAAAAKPLPRITPDNAPFWEGCRQHRLVLPFCAACGRPHLPPGPVCPFCFGDAIEWRPASGRGTLATFTIVHKEWFPAFRVELPYNVAQIELEEGPRLTANIAGSPNEALAVGKPVEIVFDDVTPEITLPRFRLS
ncbi:MAG: OB-fold domain-containing protein [Alphaproteobacteria bacterium]|nr:OB-fold domain-containing protein [Alphaproteobacteria bacterium]